MVFKLFCGFHMCKMHYGCCSNYTIYSLGQSFMSISKLQVHLNCFVAVFGVVALSTNGVRYCVCLFNAFGLWLNDLPYSLTVFHELNARIF